MDEEPITTFPRAVRFLDGLHNFERRQHVTPTNGHFDLSRMRTLCGKIGDPQLKLNVVHVAGTKGKGSTCAMIASMLRAAGYTVGLYSSPHLVDVRERLRILRPSQDRTAFPQGEMITRGAFARCVKKVQPAVSTARQKPTYFDVLTAVAFTYFMDEEVDIAIIETGLGGRLDSTNVVEPLVTAITPISLDHTKQLGPTIDCIAREKAGIFKADVPAIAAPQPHEEEAVPALRQVALAAGTRLKLLGEDIDFTTCFEASRSSGRNNRVGFETERSSFDHLPVPLLGEHQAVNCGLALAVVDELREQGWEVSDDDCHAGLDGLKLEGRMEVLRSEPTVLADVAHNPASVEALLKAIGQHFSYDSSVVIFGCCDDKDAGAMLGKLVSGADKTIFCRVESPRSADPKALAKTYSDKYGRMSQTAESLEEALDLARRSISGDDLICITGSFYLVGTAKRLLAKRQK